MSGSIPPSSPPAVPGAGATITVASRDRLILRRFIHVLRDYCEFGILPRGGEFALACPPDIEASIYRESKVPESGIYPEIRRIQQPVTVIRAGKTREAGVFDLSTSPTGPDLAAYFRRGRDMAFEDCTHYIPMEAPERVAEHIRRQTEPRP